MENHLQNNKIRSNLTISFIVLLVFSFFNVNAVTEPDSLGSDSLLVNLEGYTTIEGISGVTIYDDFENGNDYVEYSIFSNGKNYKLNLENAPEGLISGKQISVYGAVIGDEINVQSYNFDSFGSVALLNSENIGEQKTIVLLVNSFENPVQPITLSEAYDRVFSLSRADSIHSWIKEVSYERTSLLGDVSGWHTLSLTRAQLCQQGISGEQAILNEVDSSVNFSLYERVLIVFPDYSGCGYNGIATVGKKFYTNDGGVILSVQRLNGESRINDGTGSHEFGHNFGAKHANAWDCGSGIITGTCNSIERYDLFDILGSVWGGGHFNVVHKDIIGWFDTDEILQVGSEDRTYILEPLETVGGLKALKIPSSGFNFYVEYRRPIGYDNNSIYNNIGWGMLGKDVYRGAMIHTDVFGSNGDSQLLDMLPNSNANTDLDISDSVLEVGTTFTYDGLSITPTILNDDYLVVCVGNTANCNYPPVLDSVSNISVTEGDEVFIDLNANDPNGGNGLVYSTNAGSVLPSSFTINSSTGEFSWTPNTGDAGGYDVEFSVTDGQFINTIIVRINVQEGYMVHHLAIPYHPTETYSSAATAQMILDYFGNYQAQSAIYSYGFGYKLASGAELDTLGMDAVLGHYDPYDNPQTPTGNSYTGYNFQARSFSDVNTYLRDISHWMDYPVHQYSGGPLTNPEKVPPAVPLFGNYNNWVVVNGFVSDADPLPDENNPFYTPNFNVLGFYITNPSDGNFVDHFITATEAVQTYFLPINVSDSFNGKYVQVAEPPEVESTATVGIKSIDASAYRISYPADGGVLYTIQSWESAIPETLMQDQSFVEALEGSVEREVVEVNYAHGKYSLVPFDKKRGTTVVLAVGESGRFIEAAWDNPQSYEFISQQDAYNKIVMRYGPITDYTAERYWNPKISNTLIKSGWKFVSGTTSFYVKPDGTVFLEGKPKRKLEIL